MSLTDGVTVSSSPARAGLLSARASATNLRTSQGTGTRLPPQDFSRRIACHRIAIPVSALAQGQRIFHDVKEQQCFTRKKKDTIQIKYFLRSFNFLHIHSGNCFMTYILPKLMTLQSPTVKKKSGYSMVRIKVMENV